MTILPDHEIAARIRAGTLRIEPWLPDSLQPSSVDLHLGPVLLVDTPDGFREHRLDDDGPYGMYPGDCILAATLECVTVPPDLVAVLVGKSSLARLFLETEAAGYVDPGWHGRLTVELVKRGHRPVGLSYGMSICQIRFETMLAPATRPYGTPGVGSRYQNSLGPVPSYLDAGKGGHP